jgi:hypothetical protein
MPPLERETGFEPATSTLARLHSTAELFPRLPHEQHKNYKIWISMSIEKNPPIEKRTKIGPMKWKGMGDLNLKR